MLIINRQSRVYLKRLIIEQQSDERLIIYAKKTNQISDIIELKELIMLRNALKFNGKMNFWAYAKYEKH